MKTRKSTGELFNATQKNKFLNSNKCKEPSFSFHLFEGVYQFEKKYNKDFIYFSSVEGKELLESFQYKSVLSVKHVINVISTYAKFCGVTKTYYADLPSEEYRHFVFKKVRPFSGEEIQDILYSLNLIREKPKTALIILAPFEGVLGKEKAELINLRKKDLLPNNTLAVGERNISISDQLYYIIQKIITDNNLKADDFLLGGTGKYNITITYHRLREVVKETIGREDFTPHNIFWSGIWNRINQTIDTSTIPFKDIFHTSEFLNIQHHYGIDLLSTQDIKIQLKKFL